jgi:hypothetical protein
MLVHPNVTMAAVQQAVERSYETLDNPGFCIRCGCEVDGVEPDARKLECEGCGARAVYGAEELFMSDLQPAAAL